MLPQIRKNIHSGHQGVAICLRIEKKSPNPQRRLKSLKHTLRVLALPSNWSAKKAHSLYQVHSRSSPTAGVSITPLYHTTTARQTWEGKVEAGVKVARPMLRKTAKFGHEDTSHALHQECNITRPR